MSYEITGRTVLTGLLGSPVEHSISPMMHNYSFRELGLDYAYLAFNVGTEQLKTAVEGLKTLGVRGFNLTMPDKNEMCLLADQLSDAARICGAVNTIVNDDGILTGYTTDGIGFMRALREDGMEPKGKKMTILGAGGAAMAMLVQAALDGTAEITVFNRPGAFYDRAQQVMEELRNCTGCRMNIYDYSDPKRFALEIRESAVLANATSVGMAPNTGNSLVSDQSLFREDLYVFDAIYNPRETKLLKEARKAGAKTQNGLDMLLYQGAEAFRLWTGHDMPVEKVKENYFTVDK